METIRRFLKAGKQNFFLLGPRGTGKSTFIKSEFPEALYVDLLLPDVFRNYSAYPERLREAVHAKKGNKTILIDEVQKAPELLEVVHSLIEEKLGFHYYTHWFERAKAEKSRCESACWPSSHETYASFYCCRT